MDIRVSVEGDGAVIRGIGAYKVAFSRETMVDIGTHLLLAANERVDRGVDIHGKKIKPSVRALEEGGQTLRDKGHMLGGYQILKIKAGAPGARVTVGFSAAKEGQKARAHQFGLGHLPKRPVFGFSEKDEKAIEKIVEESIRGAISAAEGRA